MTTSKPEPSEEIAGCLISPVPDDHYICATCPAIVNEVALIDHEGHRVSNRGGALWPYQLTANEIRGIVELRVGAEVPYGGVL